MSMIGICKARAPYRNMLSPRPPAARSCFWQIGIGTGAFSSEEHFRRAAFVCSRQRQVVLEHLGTRRALVDLVLKDDPEKLSPLWNPVRLARELGQTREPGGSEPRRDAIARNGMFGAPTFRWLPAKSAIHTFLRAHACRFRKSRKRAIRERHDCHRGRRKTQNHLAGVSAFERSALGQKLGIKISRTGAQDSSCVLKGEGLLSCHWWKIHKFKIDLRRRCRNTRLPLRP